MSTRSHKPALQRPLPPATSLPCVLRQEAPGSDNQEEDPETSPDSSIHGLSRRNSGSNSFNPFGQYPDTPFRHGGRGNSCLYQVGQNSSPGQSTCVHVPEICGGPENQGHPGGDDDYFRTSAEESEIITETYLQEGSGIICERLESLGGKQIDFSSEQQETQGKYLSTLSMNNRQ